MYPSTSDAVLVTIGVLLVTTHLVLSRTLLLAAASSTSDLFLRVFGRPTARNASEEQFVARELAEFRLGNFRLFSGLASQIGLPVTLLMIRDTFHNPCVSMMCGTGFCLLGCFLLLQASGCGWCIQSDWISFTCAALYALIVGSTLTTAFVDKEVYAMKHTLCFVGHLIAGMSCCSTVLSVPFSLAFAGSSVLSYVSVMGWDHVDALFVLVQLMELGMCIGVPAVLELVVSKRAAACHRAQEADSLNAGFRRIVKGLSDGDLLLDSHLKMCNGPGTEYLQQLLSSDEDYVGRKFTDLLDEGVRSEVEHFLSSESPSGVVVAPRCYRVHLKSKMGPRAVDLFHVPLSRLAGSPCHLLAISVDSEAVSARRENLDLPWVRPPRDHYEALFRPPQGNVDLPWERPPRDHYEVSSSGESSVSTSHAEEQEQLLKLMSRGASFFNSLEGVRPPA